MTIFHAYWEEMVNIEPLPSFTGMIRSRNGSLSPLGRFGLTARFQVVHSVERSSGPWFGCSNPVLQSMLMAGSNEPAMKNASPGRQNGRRPGSEGKNPGCEPSSQTLIAAATPSPPTTWFHLVEV